MTRQSNQFIEFLHPDGVFEICLIGTKTPKSDLWEGYANSALTGRSNNRLKAGVSRTQDTHVFG